MAQNYSKSNENDKKSEYEYEFKSDYLSDWDTHRSYIQDFDSYEAMLIGQVFDTTSKSVDGSKITDSYATTLAKERADRVMAKLPDGNTESVGRADVGKAMFMDILRQKWIYPNANAQRPFQEKLNLWQFYSSIYGYMPMFYDWTTSNTGYVGPDCWLWNPRNLVPQQGKVSIEDMDYVTALTWVSKKRIQDIIDNEEEGDGWDRDALTELVGRIDSKTSGDDANQDTLVERTRAPGGTKRGICLATRYEAGPDGKWCTFCPDDGFIKIRELDNPHKNGRIPFVVKYSQPLFDSFYGLGDFQRAKPLQFARDGLTNFYFANLKRNLAPGIIVNANGVVKHTLDVTKANPVLMETIPNSIRPMPTNTAGLSTYQAAQTNLTGSLLSQFGTQNASIPGAEALNPSQGKTPAAIGLYSSKEATRDGADLRHLEVAIEQLTDGFFSMVANIGTEDIPVTLFADDIEDIIKSGLTDLQDMFKNFKLDETGTAGDLTIKPGALKGVEYKFNINPDSTAKTNKDAQRQALENWMGMIGKLQNVIQSDPRVKVQWPTIMSAYGGLIDLPEAEDFITVDENAQPTPTAPPPISPTAVKMPSGQVHETADLVKMFASVDDINVKNAILEAMNLPPMQPQAPEPITNSAGSFQDPHVAQAAEALMQGTQSPQTPEPTVNAAGMFNDPHVAQAANNIVKG